MLAGREGDSCPQRGPSPPHASPRPSHAPRVERRVFDDAEFEHQLLGQPWVMPPCSVPGQGRGALWVRSDALHGTWVFHPMEQLSVSFPTASGTRCAAAWGMINHILVRKENTALE